MMMTTSLSYMRLSFPWWIVAMQDTCYKSIPSLRDSELKVPLLRDRGTTTSRSFRYPGPGYTSRNLVNSFSPLLKWDSAAYLTEEHTIRHDLTSFLTLESRPKRQKKPKPIFKLTLKILLNPNQFIFKPFIFFFKLCESQDLKKKKQPKNQGQNMQTILFLSVKMKHFSIFKIISDFSPNNLAIQKSPKNSIF